MNFKVRSTVGESVGPVLKQKNPNPTEIPIRKKKKKKNKQAEVKRI